jgi:hypothetical protein
MLAALEMLAPLAPLARGMRFCDQLDVQITLEEYVCLRLDVARACVLTVSTVTRRRRDTSTASSRSRCASASRTGCSSSRTCSSAMSS